MIRIFQHGDHLAIARIFTAAVQEIAPEAYTREQCDAWAPKEVDYAHWRNRCELKRPFVAMAGEHIAGFLELDPDGHIDCAYINPKFRQKGIMTSLVKHAIAVCFSCNIDKVHVEASICALPMFEKLGFTLIREHLVEIRGEKLINYSMELLKENDL